MQNAQKLKEIAVHIPSYEAGLNKVIDPTVQKGWQIDPLKVSAVPDNDFKEKTVPALVNLAMACLGLSTAAVTVEAHLVQVLRYESGGHFKKHRNEKMKVTIFISIQFLKLPLIITFLKVCLEQCYSKYL